MQRYAALGFVFCLGWPGNAQGLSSDPSHPVTTRTPDPSCDSMASNRPGLSKEDFVRAVVSQTVCRGSFIMSDGVHGWTFIPISNEDREAVLALGQTSIPTLALIADNYDSTFAQLIAVRLIADVGGSDAVQPLVRALDWKMWQPTRMAALYGIGKEPKEVANPILTLMKSDADPKIVEIATYLLKDLQLGT
ncbi:hypothetical protein HDF16_006200 [Granulicella aggregans]|uniref:HEAT repeat protein n=1 Tax=Granulicella aggregans TaxID=474949 RepID=A0A7W7ZK82_9BACT|nr:hypothetical protein [Granulicella aggregans]MBB5061464.1 hypothetical protein [Granulicella aggregans]